MLDARCGPYLQSLASKERHTSQKKKAWEATTKCEKFKH
jgi:hypothetical protein